MTCAEAASPTSPFADAYLWENICAGAIVTRNTGMTTVVLVPRPQGIVRWARYVARRVGTQVTAEVTAGGVKLRFQARSEEGSLWPSPTAAASPPQVARVHGRRPGRAASGLTVHKHEGSARTSRSGTVSALPGADMGGSCPIGYEPPRIGRLPRCGLQGWIPWQRMALS